MKECIPNSSWAQHFVQLIHHASDGPAKAMNKINTLREMLPSSESQIKNLDIIQRGVSCVSLESCLNCIELIELH